MYIVILLIAITVLWMWSEHEARAEENRVRQEEKVGHNQVLPFVEAQTTGQKAGRKWKEEDIRCRQRKESFRSWESRRRRRRQPRLIREFKTTLDEDIDWQDERCAPIG